MVHKLKYIIKLIRFIYVLLVGKLIFNCCKLRERLGLSDVFLSATCVPGHFILRNCFDFLTFAEKYCRKEIIAVSGTNGKSTTSWILAEILRKDGRKLVHNRDGSNTILGIVSTLAGNVFPKTFDNYVYEVDEANISELCKKQKVDYLVLTNLFEDPLFLNDLSCPKTIINCALKDRPSMKLLLNADEPLFYDIQHENIIRFGIKNVVYLQGLQHLENLTNPKICQCDKSFQFEKEFYSGIGHYFCECGVKRKTPDIEANVAIGLDCTKLEVFYKNSVLNFTTTLKGIHNAYNVLAAISQALLLNVDPNIIQKSLDSFIPFMGRNESMKILSKDVSINLVKNITGFDVVINAMDISPNDVVLFAFNAQKADGGDSSWLKKTNLANLQKHNNLVIVSGEDAKNVCSILKCSGCNNLEVENNLKTALLKAVQSVGVDGKVVVLINYTALFAFAKITRNKNFIEKYEVFSDRLEI